MRTPISLILLLLTVVTAALADEGMWLYSDPPRELLKKRYGFTVTDSWLEQLQTASVRFNNGGSGSFVSPEGLVMTNHHVAADAIAKLSSAEKDYTNHGFHAATRAEELPCHDLELNVLMGIEDVTARIKGAVKPGMSSATAEKARRAAMNTLEKESLENTGLRSDVVTLYRGGLYHLYRYKRYTDVRLVFAPEVGAAFFGGDVDNFEYPRYCLDVAFFRVYEDGKPAQPPSYLPWSLEGIQDGELVFVSGHPGRTERLNTVAHLEYLRDLRYPTGLNVLRRMEVSLTTWGERDAENARRARDDLFGVQNARKAYLGMLAGLQSPPLMNRKRQEEKALRRAVDANPELKAKYGDAWDAIAEAVAIWRTLYVRYYLLESARAFDSRLFGIARQLVRVAQEQEKSNADRLREYRESNLASLKQHLFSEAPIYADLETIQLVDSLGMFLEMAGAEDPLAQEVMGEKAPRDRAAELVQNTRLTDVAYRKELFEGGLAAVKASHDPMIELALQVDPEARRLREQYEQLVAEPMEQAYGKIAQAILATGGKDVYPDATFTLRLAFGTVSGYTQDGQAIPYTTRIGGLYKRAASHDSEPPYQPPRSWIEARDSLNLDKPFDFVSTPDITGGNSGSPVVNRQGEVVGLIFDGNIQSLVLDFQYTDQVARAVSVDAQAIIEALKKVYEAEALVTELTGHSGSR